MVTTRSKNSSNRPATAEDTKSKQSNNGLKKAKKSSQKRVNDVPSPKKQARQKTTPRSKDGNKTLPTVLEKGVLYYFIRARVNIDTPESINDIARGYLILHPIPTQGKLKDGPLPSSSKSRLIALPKKVLPASPKDRFMAFVEKSDASYENLRGEFLQGQEYETKTSGHRHRPDATAVGEGVYVLTSTRRESHLSYMMTLPEEMGELQNALHLRKRGSFIISSKNPTFKGPENARLPQGPDYPKEVIEKFDKLRWAPTQPEFLDYANAQVLLIGDKAELGKEVEEERRGGQDGEGDDPVGVLQELETEDIDRMKHLSKDEADAIYEDLHSEALSHPDLQKSL